MALDLKININGAAISPYAASSNFSGGATYDYDPTNAVTFDRSFVPNAPPNNTYGTVFYSDGSSPLSGTFTGLNASSTYRARFHTFGRAIGSGSRIWKISANGAVKVASWNTQENGENVASVAEFTITGVTSLAVLMESIGATVAILSAFELIEIDATAPTVTLSATPASSSRINLSYTASDNVAAVSWDLDYSLDNAAWTSLLSASTYASPYAHTGRAASTLYYYRFRARDAAGNVSAYAYAQATTPAIPPPDVPPVSWLKKRIVPMSSLAAWLSFEDQNLGTGAPVSHITDISGNGRTVAAASNLPTFQNNVLADSGGAYFDGTKSPLFVSGAFTLKHLFAVIAVDEALFSNYNGIISDSNATGVLVGETGTNRFYNYGYGAGYQYRIADVSLPAAGQLAPTGNKAAVIEIVYPAGFALNNLQIGQNRTFTANKFKGYFIEGLFYSEVKDAVEREKVYNYIARKFHLWRQVPSGLHVFPFPASFTRNITYDRKVLTSNAYSGKQSVLLRGARTAAVEPVYDGNRPATEFDGANAFHEQHYGYSDFVFRDWKYFPARDTTVRFTSGIKDEGGETAFFNYSYSADGVAAPTGVSEEYGLSIDNSGDTFIVS